MKYEFTGETKQQFGTTLYQIRALVDIPKHGVKVGDLGGWIKKESNLSQEGSCWVSGNAQVYDNARVSDNAWVYDNARVSDKAWVSGNAHVSGNAQVCGNAWVSDNARVLGNARVETLFDLFTFNYASRVITGYKANDDKMYQLNNNGFSIRIEECPEYIKTFIDYFVSQLTTIQKKVELENVIADLEEQLKDARAELQQI